MDARAGLLRALCFHDAWEYAPTRAEWMTSWDGGKSVTEVTSIEELEKKMDALCQEKIIQSFRGRYVFFGRESLVVEHEKRESYLPRKFRRIRLVVRWLCRLSGVRFVALCNTTALANARDEGDLDFFIITKQGSLWQTRALAALPFRLLRLRPGDRTSDRDAVCLSFFVDDSALDLSSLMLKPDDPYFRHWFLSLLPLYDDGVSRFFWEANMSIRQRHPCAVPWITHPELVVSSRWRLPIVSWIEARLRSWQERAFPSVLQWVKNQDTRVVVHDHVLKMHVEDGRATFRLDYEERCKRYDVEP